MSMHTRHFLLRCMLRHYQEWKHPRLMYEKNPKHIQHAKDMFYMTRKMYNKQMQKDFHSR